ncbi:MAG TPA: Nramp family divalent metal transporter [Caulifigura sp.]|nr:Nramp family divalent metal transporter [Caulifigura sp.]
MSKPDSGEVSSVHPGESSSRKLQVGSTAIPPWNVAELPEAPKFQARHFFAMIGPAIIAGGSAIGGGEWLMGPTVTARYGGALLWLATVSILAQVIYNIEISRYTLYSGEPIMNGKFRTLPGPALWLWLYLFVDVGAIIPYLSKNAATPLFVLLFGRVPGEDIDGDPQKIMWLSYAVFLISCTPLIFGGKVYRSLKALMTFKIVVVLGFLMVLAVFYSNADTWKEIGSGFFRFGTIPVRMPEDRNANGQFDAGETDWDGDGHPDVIEPNLQVVKNSSGPDKDEDGKPDLTEPDVDGDKKPDKFVSIGEGLWWPDLDGDGKPDPRVSVKGTKNENIDLALPADPSQGPFFRLTDSNKDGTPEKGFVDLDGDGINDGDYVENVFTSVASGNGIPYIDLSMIAFLAAFAAIAGNGGLTNTPISGLTRDQGWGMGAHVGAIPSMVGGVDVKLSHVGSVFEVTPEAMPRWRSWVNRVRRDQFLVWMPACFVGIALPSMLSLVFLRRGTPSDDWTTAVMTSQGVYERVLESSQGLASFCWFMTLFCGFLTLSTAQVGMIDGFVRRWVDLLWSGSKRLQKVDPTKIKYIYFGVLCLYFVVGITTLTLFPKPTVHVKLATNMMNFGLGISCWHTLYVNHSLLPKPLRPGWFVTLSLVLAGVFFLVLAVLAFMQTFGFIS